MNKLPKVLRNEIWEYVRGDRAYWKQRHQEFVTDEMHILIDKVEVELFHLQPTMLTKTDLLVMHCKLPKPYWHDNIPRFMCHQHKCHGQLFADTYREYDTKSSEWSAWCRSHTTLIQDEPTSESSSK